MFLFNSVRNYIGDMYLYVQYIYIYLYIYVCVNLNLSSPMNICNMGRSGNSTGLKQVEAGCRAPGQRRK